MDRFYDLLNLMGMGGARMGSPLQPRLPRLGSPNVGRFSNRAQSGFGFPTKPCPHCGGTGVVPDMETMTRSMGIGQREG